MLSSNNILSPAHGAPLTTPTQDMVLGTYYLTYGADGEELEAEEKRSPPHAPRTRRTGTCSAPRRRPRSRTRTATVKLHDYVQFRPHWMAERPRLHDGRPHHLQRPHRAGAGGDAGRGRVRPHAVRVRQPVAQEARRRDAHRRADPGLRRRRPSRRCSTRSRTLGFHYATLAGVTVSKNDVIVPPSKQEILEDYEGAGRRGPRAVRGRPDHPGGAPPRGHRQVERGDRRRRRGDDREHQASATR